MNIVTINELEQQGVAYQTASQFVFQNKIFKKGQSFSLRMRQAAINLCENYQASGILCLLVESTEHITLCTARQEVKSRPPAGSLPAAPLAASAPLPTAPSAPANPVSPVLKYRGTPIPTPGTAAVSAASAPPEAPTPAAAAPVLMYRGVPIKQSPPPAAPDPATAESPAPSSNATPRRTYRGVDY